MSRTSPARPILVIQHAGCEPPGAYEDVLIERQIPFARVLLDEGEELPGWTAYAGIVVMGGPMGACDDAIHPWLAVERRLIAEAVGAGMPYWGVCLGAQLLAASLGARIARGPRPELGMMDVELTAAAQEDPVFEIAPATFTTLQWHGDTYELPPGALRLAASALYEQQAFVLGRAYALQFHLEVTSALASEWLQIPDYVEELERHAGDGAPARLLEQLRTAEARSIGLAQELFSRWLQRVVYVPAAGA